ncbi:hypothetical protein EDC96DRAFT_582317 [Choanephora cucurbitarum]|nr:hypothetical protein EDC96DRAFT_582317 [Choanephora cucurbitarum]
MPLDINKGVVDSRCAFCMYTLVMTVSAICLAFNLWSCVFLSPVPLKAFFSNVQVEPFPFFYGFNYQQAWKAL